MITILTYHNIRPANSSPSGDHYTVSLDLLRSHLETLRHSSMVGPEPEKLRQPSRLGSASFFLTFDDGDALHATLTAPLLESWGLRGIFFVPTQRFDRIGYLSAKDAQKMAAAGHLFGLHGHRHRRLDLLSESELAEDFSQSLEIFLRIVGSKPWFFAPVGGYGSSRVDRAAADHGVEVIRTMRWGLNHAPDPHALETIPISRDFDPQQLEKILQAGRFGRGYHTKEIIKKLLPETLYNRVRQSLPRISKGLALPSAHE